MEDLLDEVWRRMHDAFKWKRYFEEISTRYRERHKRVSIFQAVVTSGAVGSWVLWSLELGWFKMSWLLSILLAVAAVVSIVYPILNYARIIEASGNCATRWSNVQIAYERVWRNRGRMTELQLADEVDRLAVLEAEGENDRRDVPADRDLENLCYNKAKERYS